MRSIECVHERLTVRPLALAVHGHHVDGGEEMTALLAHEHVLVCADLNIHDRYIYT